MHVKSEIGTTATAVNHTQTEKTIYLIFSAILILYQKIWEVGKIWAIDVTLFLLYSIDSAYA